MTTKILNRTLIILRTTFVVCIIGIIPTIIFTFFFPTLETALSAGTMIILLLFVCIVDLLCYLYFREMKLKRDNEAINKEQYIKYENLQSAYNQLKEDKEYYQRQCKYLERKCDREATKTETLSTLINSTFNQVLNNSSYGK